MLEDIKVFLSLENDESKDKLLMLLIERASDEVRNYCWNFDGPEYESLVAQIVVYNYNRLATEGIDAENYSGVSFSYSADYPESILRQLRTHRKVKTICGKEIKK